VVHELEPPRAQRLDEVAMSVGRRSKDPHALVPPRARQIQLAEALGVALDPDRAPIEDEANLGARAAH